MVSNQHILNRQMSWTHASINLLGITYDRSIESANQLIRELMAYNISISNYLTNVVSGQSMWVYKYISSLM